MTTKYRKTKTSRAVKAAQDVTIAKAVVKAAAPTFHSLATELYESFTQGKRIPKREGEEGETYYFIKDSAPAWIKEGLSRRVHEAIDDRMPDDWVFTSMASIASKFTDYGDDQTVETMRDTLHEIADGEVDIYNADLTTWLTSHLGNIALVDEAVEEMGWDNDAGIIGAIRAGQYHALETITNALIGEIESELGRRA